MHHYPWRCFFLLLILLISFSGCLQKDANYQKENVVSKSQRSRPFWIKHQRLEDQTFLYFIGSSRSVHNISTFAYERARADLHVYLKEDAVRFFGPVKTVLSQSAYQVIGKKYSQFVSKEIMEVVRKHRVSYSETIELYHSNQLSFRYDYYVLIRVDRTLLRAAQRRFILREKKIALLERRTLLEQALSKSYEVYQSYLAEQDEVIHTYKKTLLK